MKIREVEIANRKGEEYLFARYLDGNFKKYPYPAVLAPDEFIKLPDDIKAAFTRAGVTASSLSLGQRKWFVLEPRQPKATSASSSSSAASSSSAPPQATAAGGSSIAAASLLATEETPSSGLGDAIREFGSDTAVSNLGNGTGNTATNVMAALGDESAQYASAIRAVDPNADQQLEDTACCVVKAVKCCWNCFCD
ncbi:MAG: hypothetical protein JSS32_05140 [Verrucomicrobia bacterium]|nr:hypothetical protein [Verrucomicrobiota bacterium]